MSRVRHSKTTSRTVNGVTYRTTQSRGYFWGPYATPGETWGMVTILAVLVIVLFFCLWPWLLTAIPRSARVAIAVAWYGLIFATLIVGVRAKRRRKGTPVAAPPAVATPPRPATAVPTKERVAPRFQPTGPNSSGVQPTESSGRRTGPGTALSGDLLRLAALHRSGDLSDAEFQAAKSRLLGQ
jgi:hypothetical protein